MATVCPKCAHERKPEDDAFVSSLECPQCGIVYSKYTFHKMNKELENDVKITGKWRLWLYTASPLVILFVIFYIKIAFHANPHNQAELNQPISHTRASAPDNRSEEKKAYDLVCRYGKKGYTISQQIDGLIGLMRTQGKKCTVSTELPRLLSSGIYEVKIIISIDGEGEFPYTWKADINNDMVIPINPLAKKLSY